ncbi:EAL domain-containing protein [Idiomarina xiamenensis]|nr:EAL domain-containing protein [Idiomarina xiamenensis]
MVSLPSQARAAVAATATNTTTKTTTNSIKSTDALPPQPRFEHYSISDGLSQSTVFAINQDRRGFLWFATLNGLNRFDGYSFTNYHHHRNDPNSLPDDFIRTLLNDSHGNLWVGTQNGLARYQESQNNFIRYGLEQGLADNEVWDIFQDREGRLYVATASALHRYDSETDDFSALTLTYQGQPLREIKHIFQDSRGLLWLGTFDDGIYLWQRESGQVYRSQQDNPWQINIDANALFDMASIDGDYWLATDNGIYVLNKSYRVLHHYRQQDGIGSNRIRSIQAVSDHYVWAASENGMAQIDRNSQHIRLIQERAEQPHGLSNSFIYTLFKDQANTLWLGTLGGGVNRYNALATQAEHYSKLSDGDYGLSDDMVWHFEAAADDGIWIATQHGGLNLFHTRDYRFEHHLSDINQPVWSVVRGLQDRLWLIIGNQVAWYDPEQRELHPLTNQSTAPLIDLSYINDAMWLVENGNTLMRIRADGDDGFRINRYPVTGVADDITALAADVTDQVWIASRNALLRFDIRRGEVIERITQLGQTPVDALTVSHIERYGENLVIATLNQGVFIYNLLTEAVSPLNKATGALADNVIIAMQHSHQSLWIMTRNGASEVDTDGHIKRQIDYRSSSDNVELNNAWVSPREHIYLATTNGFIRVLPNAVSEPAAALNVELTQFLLLNKAVSISSLDERNQQQLLSADNVYVNYGQSPLSIEFAAPNSVNPKALSYRYRLSDVDNDWVVTSANNRRATYTNLSPGSYEFAVQASSDELNWSNARRITLHIGYPVWLQLPAIAGYAGLFLVALLILTHIFNARRQNARQLLHSEERLKLSLWGSGDQLWDWDIPNHVLFRQNTWRHFTEFPIDGERVGTEQQPSNIHPQDKARIQEALRDHLQGLSEHYEVTYRVRHGEQWLWLLDRGKVVARDESGQATRMTGTLKDITDIVAAQERIRMLATSLTNISDGICIYDQRFIICEVNNAFERITGFTREQVINQSFKLPLYKPAYIEQIKQRLASEGSWHGEVMDKRADGSTYQMELTIDCVRDDAGDISLYVASFSDISERKAAEVELRRLANTDTLTGLPNRSYFQVSHSNLVRKRLKHALLVFDLDNFKKINDSLGHEVGDHLLCQVAERLSDIGRAQDTLYRLGGDEFGLLLEDCTDLTVITSTAKTINQRLAKPFHIAEAEVVVTSSIGIVVYPNDGNSSQELLQNADNAMYHAKREGGDRYQFFSESMNQNAVRRLQLEGQLRRALKQNHLTVYYQPKVDIASGNICGLEALARIELPDGQVISPADFIPLAEETGLIVELGEKVMRQACRDMKAFLASGLQHSRVAVNLSARQFALTDLSQRLLNILQQEQLAPQMLELEITEGIVMPDPEHAITLMTALSEQGIHLALDDFGTGYSSLAYLKRFPIHSLKIDKAFVDDISHNDIDRNMVASVVAMAHHLQLTVVAEGVESADQLAVLRTLGCDQAQGYYFAKPLNASEFRQQWLPR